MKRGFTLVEVLTTIAILTGIMVAVAAFQYNVLNYNRSAGVALVNTQQAQALIRTVARELRSMEQGVAGEYPIAAAATSSLTFFADTNADGTSEKIRYYLLGNALYRGHTVPSGSPLSYSSGQESTKILVTGIANASSSPIFQYYLGTYNGTSSPLSYPLAISAIRLVRVDLNLDTDPTKTPISRTFSTQVQLRNLKDNL